MEPTQKIKPRSEKNCEKLFDTCLTKLRQSLFLGILFLTAISFAIPSDLQNYDVLSGGMTDILDGAIVEGSSRYQGLQPDYQIDLESEPLRSFMKRAENIGAMKIAYWTKVATIVNLVGWEFFQHAEYSNPKYQELMRVYRTQEKTFL